MAIWSLFSEYVFLILESRSDFEEQEKLKDFEELEKNPSQHRTKIDNKHKLYKLKLTRFHGLTKTHWVHKHIAHFHKSYRLNRSCQMLNCWPIHLILNTKNLCGVTSCQFSDTVITTFSKDDLYCNTYRPMTGYLYPLKVCLLCS